MMILAAAFEYLKVRFSLGPLRYFGVQQLLQSDEVIVLIRLTSLRRKRLVGLPMIRDHCQAMTISSALRTRPISGKMLFTEKWCASALILDIAFSANTNS